jgi:hypothetical protein
MTFRCLMFSRSELARDPQPVQLGWLTIHAGRPDQARRLAERLVHRAGTRRDLQELAGWGRPTFDAVCLAAIRVSQEGQP